MRTDVHFAALRAAAKVAFSVALLNGCSNAADVVSDDDGNKSEGEGLASSESSIVVADEDCPAKGCASVLASRFPVPGDYQWKPVPQPAEVVACCKKELTAHPIATPYRWDCCVAYDPITGEQGAPDQGFACTPWGPPVPPSMNRDRLAKRRARRVRATQPSFMAVA